jgi:hypothetical protein
MEALRKTLRDLGWPEGLTDAQIAEELLRRWFDAPISAPLVESDPAVIARGVYAALVRDGQLDALCWLPGSARSVARGITAIVDSVVHAQQAKHECADDDYAVMNRRKSSRIARSDLVDLSLDYGERRAVGWLVDVSDGGAALLMEAVNLPVQGQQVEPTIHVRGGGQDRLGAGIVVRTEMLSTDVGLVCVELDEPREFLAA